MTMRTLFLLALVQLWACSAQPAADADAVAVTPTPATEVAAPADNNAKAQAADPVAAPQPTAAPTAAAPTQTPRPDVVLKPQSTAAKPATPTKMTVEEVVPEAPAPVNATSDVPDHGLWNDLLTTHVSATGRVDYRALKAAEGRVDEYLATLKQYPPKPSWSRNETMAYWINAYNAFTVRLILKNYPTTSIKRIDGGNPWDTKWIALAGGTYSLNQIENDILRRQYGDARIHFAVNCAALSCPPLHNRAFTAKNLNTTLAQLTRKFINNKAFNQLGEREVRVSPIFDWYKSDFGNLIGFLAQYTDAPIAEDANIQYNEYDWGLNGN